MLKVNFWKRKEEKRPLQAQLAQKGRIIKTKGMREKGAAGLKSGPDELGITNGFGFAERVALYRFLRDNIPVINGAIWTWVRLCASPLEFFPSDIDDQLAVRIIKSEAVALSERLLANRYSKSGGIEQLCDLFFSSLFVDGAFAGNIEIDWAGRLAGFTPCDIRQLSFETENGLSIYRENGAGRILTDPATFIYIPLDDTVSDPRGRSILHSVGFVSRLEQKLLDDMQKSQEKAGYNRLHVLIKKPEKRLGETDNGYIERANQYFDDTVTLFSGIRPSDSAVTWDDIEIRAIGPASGSGNATHSWYLSHRALVEDICAGVHLDPFMLGYSYSSTQTWARFKYELVMREIISVQQLALRFFEWLMNTHLALSGYNITAHARFDNDRVNSALDRYKAQAEATGSIIGLYKEGLLSKDEARAKIAKCENVF